KRDFYYDIIHNLVKQGRKRVVLSFSEPIWDVLGATDVLVQRCCTTGLESCLMGLPTLELRLNSEEIFVNPERDPCMDIVTTYEQMEGKIAYYLAGGNVP